MENEKSTGNKYTVKDAAIIGIFCAVMFVVFMVYSILTGASLFYSMIFNAAGAALILAPFYVYMCMKVGKHGPALVYNIMWAIIAGLMMGPFMIPWFLGGGIIAELSMCGKDAYHDIKRVSISWVITALVRAAHGMSEIWFGSDYKKPDAITTMYKSEFKQKAWSLPVADLLYVGKSTNRKLALFGIKTIGDLARADEYVLNSHLGKMGSILWSFANGYDDSPVKLENTHAPIKSVGNSTTTPKDLVCDEDVKIVLYILAESVAARLRENGFRCRVVEISVRDNELFSFTRQKKIDHATNITGEIAAYAYQIFKENYNWSKPIRSVGVRGADLVTDNYWEQIDLFSSVEKREKQMKMDSAVDDIRRRFGFYSIQRGLMYRDRILSAVNAKEEHTVHPHGYFSG